MTHPNLESLLGGMGDGSGWDGLENIEARHKQQAEALRQSALEHAQMFDAALSTVQGKALLEWLLQMTIYRPSWLGESFQSLDKVTAYGLFRDGQNSIAWAILGAIATSRGEQSKRGD